MIDLFRCSMSPEAGVAVAKLYTPDENGRIYCGQGRFTDEFEQAFANTTGLSSSSTPLGVNSCTSAIDIALHMLGIGPGDEVICSPLTCTASNSSVVLRGAKIAWADIDAITGLMSPLSVASLLSPRTKAIIAVDWAGRACDYQGLRQMTGGNIPIIEDAAHRLYTPYKHGDYVAFSFGPIKALTTGGSGGALITPPHERKRAELLRWHGLDRTLPGESFRCEQDIKEVGLRAHMTDDQAVVGLANLPLAVQAVNKARENAAWYFDHFKGTPGLTVPQFDPTCDYWLFGLIIHEDRDGFIQRMQERGIATGRAHARNDKHTAFRAASVRLEPLMGVDYFDNHQVNIPVGHWVTEAEREQVVAAVRDSLRETTVS